MLLIAGWLGVAAAHAQPGAAEEAIAGQQALVRSVVRPDCGPAEGDEIVVCGRREEDARHRLPLPVVGPPNPADRAGGEQLAAMNAGDDRCSPVGRDQQCSGGLDVIGIGFTIARVIAKAVAGDD